jgi:fluoride ion exporter CrcB/FEX
MVMIGGAAGSLARYAAGTAIASRFGGASRSAPWS